MRSSFSDGRLRDRDIILRKLTAGGEGRVRIMAIECVKSIANFSVNAPVSICVGLSNLHYVKIQ